MDGSSSALEEDQHKVVSKSPEEHYTVVSLTLQLPYELPRCSKKNVVGYYCIVKCIL